MTAKIVFSLPRLVALSSLAVAVPILGANLSLSASGRVEPGAAVGVEEPWRARGQTARGIVVSTARAELVSDLRAEVRDVLVREGEHFERGDRLVAFDCAREEAQLRSAKALRAEAALTVKSNAYLADRRAIGRHDVEIAAAKLEKAEADVDGLRALLSKCVVEAPFDGIVSERKINAFEVPRPSEPFMTIVSARDFELELIVPSLWLSGPIEGRTFTFDIDELGMSAVARVVRTGAVVEPISQTTKLYGRFDVLPAGLRPGMSGTAVFNQSQALP